MRRLGSRFGIGLAVVLLVPGMQHVTAPSADAVTIPTDTAGHWRFDEPSGAVATDASASDNDGTITGATRVAGKDGGALSFDGDGDVVIVPDAAALEPTFAVSIAAWVRADEAPPANAVIVAKGAAACGEYSYALETGPTGLPRFSMSSGSATVATPEVTDPVWDGAWHHVVGWKEGNQLLVVVDAVGMSTAALYAPLEYGLASDELAIGGRPAACPAGPQFAGEIDDVRIYGRALSLDDIGAFQPPIETTLALSVEPQPYEYCAETGAIIATVTPAPYYHQYVLFTMTGPNGVQQQGGYTDDNGIARLSGCGLLDIGQTTISAVMEPRIIWLGSSDEITVGVTKRSTQVAVQPVSPKAAGTPVNLTATLTGGCCLPLRVYEVVDGVDVRIGTAPYEYTAEYHYAAGSLTPGTHVFKFVYPGVAWTKSSSGTVSVTVGLRSPDLFLDAYPDEAEAGTPVQLAFWSGDPQATGPVTILDITDSRQILIARGVRLPAGGTVSINVTSLKTGIRTLVARLSPSAVAEPAWSEPITIKITPDTTVKATNVTASPSTFYPYPDGYIDAVTFSGQLGEQARVVATIYNGSGTKIRTIDLGLKAGAYSAKWDGKNSSGAVVPAGVYRIVQTLTDSVGNKLAVPTNVTGSPKRLYFTTATKTLDGVAYSASGVSGTGKIVGSAYGGGIKLRSGTAGSVRAGWQFTLPAATVYKTLTFSVLGSGGVPPGSIGVMNWSLCSEWNDTCFDAFASAPIAYGWASTTASTAEHISTGRVVRGAVFASSYGSIERFVDVRDVKVTYTYGVLK